MPRNNDNRQTFLGFEMEVSANRGLFADHYLYDILPTTPDWDCDAVAAPVFKSIVELYKERASRFGPHTNESQTENDFIQPVLNLLWGHDGYQVQCIITVPDGHRQTDYAFFPDPDTRNHVVAHESGQNFWPRTVALGDAKRWSDSLDKRRAADGSPSNQILNYLYHSRVRWGILTNGRLWRLYEQDKSRQGGIYYEVNLADIIARENLEDFKRFFLFFRREAFVREPSGVCFIDRVYRGSIDYATTVGERLKESVYDALRYLMNGFLAVETNGLDRHNAEDLKLVHSQSLILLYRILFVLYAEDRRLLDVNEPFYHNRSLRKLQQSINLRLRQGAPPFFEQSFEYWTRLCEIFEIIDEGLSTGQTQRIPAFNGGLFSAGNHPHITGHHRSEVQPWLIGDESLAWTIDLLAYSHEKWDEAGEKDIDYTSLDVRHLGSIYEGLLELQPSIAVEPLVEVYDRELKSAVFRRAAEVVDAPKIRNQNPRRIRIGEVYLVSNRGERRVTGSYYTPKYIVDYIVEKTLTPLLQQASAKVAKLRRETDANLRRLESEFKERMSRFPDEARREQLGEDYLKGSDEAKAVIEQEYTRNVFRLKQGLLQPFFEIKVLDPSMGSGHFLVGAADFISLHLATEPKLYDPTDLGCGAEEDPQLFYKRLVVERCLYGVDLNPLAVELAKLSLWLHTVSRDRALSFLDHHLRCGNSLVGARLEQDLSEPPPVLLKSGKRKKMRNASNQIRFGFADVLRTHELDRFLRTFHAIAEKPGGEASIEREKHRWYADMDRFRLRYRQVANLWLAGFFGLEITADLYERTVHALESNALEDWEAVAVEPMFQQAQEIASQYRFFHWELEFPEVFLEGATGESNFSAVIGNPPYVRQETLGPALKNYFDSAFASYAGTADLYVYFIEAGHEKLRPEGRFGMITSNKYMRANYGQGIRQYLAAHATLESIVDFGELPVFEDAATFPSILISSRSGQRPERQSFSYAPVKTLNFESLDAEVEQATGTLDERALAVQGWSLSNAEELAIFEKMKRNSVPLGKYVGGEIYRGVLTGLNEAFVIDGATRCELITADPANEELIKPFVVGDDIRKYRINRKDRWLILIPNGWTNAQRGDEDAETWFAGNYASLYAWFLPLREKAMKRWDKGDYWWELRPCDYYEKFTQPKIVYPDIAKSSRFCFSSEVLYTGNTAYMIETTDLSLLGLLNSKLILSYFRNNSTILGDANKGGRMRWFSQFVINLPIAKDTNESPLAESASRMLELNENLQREQEGFLAWLRRTFELHCERLNKHRNRLMHYDEDDFDAFIKALKANADQLPIDPACRSFQEQVQPEFEKSVGRIREFRQEIATTDRHIDALVYELYGLTAEEIAVVEASAG